MYATSQVTRFPSDVLNRPSSMISICFHLSLLISSGDIPVFLAEDPVPEQGSPVVDSVVLQLLGAVPPVASRVFDPFPSLQRKWPGWRACRSA